MTEFKQKHSIWKSASTCIYDNQKIFSRSKMRVVGKVTVSYTENKIGTFRAGRVYLDFWILMKIYGKSFRKWEN